MSPWVGKLMDRKAAARRDQEGQGVRDLASDLFDARRERDEARATLAELRAHGIDIDNGIWTGRVRLSDGSSPMTDEIEEAFKELAALKTQAAYLREVLHGISMMSEEAVLEEPDRAQRIAREALLAHEHYWNVLIPTEGVNVEAAQAYRAKIRAALAAAEPARP